MTDRTIITSALPYINSIKHLGNLVGSILPGDVYCRYLKLKGKDVIYICGTDDHGTPAELSAHEAGKDVAEFCDEMYETQKRIYDEFGIGFDYFGRTHDQENHDITQDIFLKLQENGYILEKTDVQLYSLDDERYLPDRYVIGTCPHCEYDRARGDQCENCTTLLDPQDLINPRSAISGSENLEKRDVTHFYIDLPALEPKIKEWIDTQTGWPQTSISIAKKWLNEGLQARAITRNLSWGIDLPIEGHDDKVFYVWFDAPIGYISITKKWADKIVKKPELFDAFWHDTNTDYYQFIGIDNVPFHAITFPGTMLGFNDNNDKPYNLTNFIKGSQWLTYEGGKFSSSQNRGIFTDQALELYPADYWRYYLMLISPERQDTDFQWDGFQNAVNNDLNNLLGNLVNRFSTFVSRHFDDTIPEGVPGDREEELQTRIAELVTEYDTEFSKVEFQKPLKALRAIWQELNRYFQDKQPWATVKEEATKADTATTVATLAHGLRLSAILLAPFAPHTSQRVFESIGLQPEDVHEIKWDDLLDFSSLAGTSVPELKGNLFEKIPNKDIEKLKERFGSSESKEEKSKKSKKSKSKKEKKEKKSKNNEDSKEKEGKKSKYIDYDDFEKVKLKAVKVLKAEPHPKADKLMVLTVDDGERDDRTIVAGIREFYQPEELEGQTIIIVDNLKPAKLRGIKSEGMLLAAEDGKTVSFLTPFKDVDTGSKIK